METELAINLVGLVISALIGRFAYTGYTLIASPNLLRLTLAFVSIAAGFALVILSLFVQPDSSRIVTTIGLAVQTVGYFFIAISHGLKSSFDFAPHKGFALVLLPLAATPFVIPGNSIEHIIRSISFILLVYVSIETLASYMQSLRTNTLMIGLGLGTLAIAELLAWYDFIFPGSFNYPAMITKVGGFGLLFVPFSKFGLTTGGGDGRGLEMLGGSDDGSDGSGSGGDVNVGK